MSSTSRVTSQQTELHVAWSETSEHPATQPTNLSTQVQSQEYTTQDQKDTAQDHTQAPSQYRNSSLSVTSPYPNTSCANSVTADPNYVTATPSSNTVVTTAVVHAQKTSPKPQNTTDCETGRADSDSDAKIDSLSSSDLENCEELESEFSPSSPAPEGLPPLKKVQESPPVSEENKGAEVLPNDSVLLTQPSASVDLLTSSAASDVTPTTLTESATSSNPSVVPDNTVSLTPQLSSSAVPEEPQNSISPTSDVMDDVTSSSETLTSGDHMMSLKDFENLPPPLWEDGGTSALDRGQVDYSPWKMFGSDDSVRVFREQWGQEEEQTETAQQQESLEEREEDIEETLRNIYVSPFQENTAPKASHTQPRILSPLMPATPSTQFSGARTSSTELVGGLGGSILVKFPTQEKRHKFTPTNGRFINPEDYPPFKKVPNSAGNDDNENEDDKNEDGDACPRGPVEEYTPCLARVAERAVSGYRSCDDVEEYVGTKQPKLILARAPPSPSGILRRNNRKSSNTKAPPSGVRFAEGRTPKPRFADDVT